MTCIVGRSFKGAVVIGGDSVGSNGSDKVARKDTKVFVKGPFVFGCSSSFRMIQLLKYSFNPPEVKKEIYEYMCTDFINEVRNCFREGGFLQSLESGEEQGGQFLVGYRDCLFKIDNDFQVAENISGIDGCGCGAPYAIGALHVLKDNEDLGPLESVRKALEISEELSEGVGQPFTIETTWGI